MLRYANEAAFAKAVVKQLRKKGWFVQRIESGLTGRGIPDIYAVDPTHTPFWLELKRMRIDLRGKDRCAISWRPGQQAWLNAVSRYGQKAFTLAAFNDCILLIPHTSIWANDIVLFSKCQIIFNISDL